MALDPALRAEKERLDLSKDYEELKALRELAVFYLKRERGLDEAAASAQGLYSMEYVLARFSLEN